MNRRVTGVALAGALFLAGLAGCGIPESSEVQVDGRAPAAEAGSVNGRRDEPPARMASGSDPSSFVHNFLSAAAGESDRTYYRVKQFVAPEGKSLLQEKQGSEVAVNVIRLKDSPVITTNSDGTSSVEMEVQQIGLLRANGTLAPPVATETEYRFTLRDAASPGSEDVGAGLYVIDPPNVLLLSDRALRQYYQTHTVYFWSSDQTRLVPDQRYLPVAVPDERQVTEVVKWLTAGPADWLAHGVTRLPDRTELINNATETDGRWEINLTMSGDDDAKLDRLATQLAWSLPKVDGHLELKIRNQTRLVIDNTREHRLSHPAYPISGSPQRFSVYDEAVHPLTFAGEPTDSVPIVPAANRKVVSAALSRTDDGTLAALVVAGSDKRQRLAVGTGTGSGPVEVFTRSAGSYASIGRPVWLRALDPRGPHGLVVADGRLYRFDRGTRMSPVPLSVPGAVTAVAASLDGHRIAVIAGGVLHVAAVSLDGGVVTVGPARRLATSQTDLSAVAWGGENTLVLAGAAGRSAIYEISVDGAVETPLKRDIGAKVTHLVAYPSNPIVPFASDVMYEANGVAYAISPFMHIEREQVQGATQPPDGVRLGNPTAPFFLY